MGMFDLSLLGSGQRRAPGGILGGEGGWQNTVGLLGAAMKDAGAAFSGGESNALQDYNARNQQMQIRQQLMGALTSPDPAIRQKAYAVAPMFGVDPAAFQKQQAAQALPSVLDATRSSTEALDPITAQLPKFNIPTAGGGTMQAGGMPVSSGSAPMLPKLSIQDAIAQSNSPELQAEWAPTLIKNQMEAEQKRLTPASAEWKRANNYNEKTPIFLDAFGNPKIEADPYAITPKDERTFANQDRTFYETRRHNQEQEKSGRDGGGGLFSMIDTPNGMYGVTRGGTVTPMVGPDGKPLVSYHSDVGLRYNMSAAGAGGSAGGAAAEAWPSTNVKFDTIGKTIKGFFDPKVREQAPKAIGFGSIAPTIPGVNSDFRSRQEQLKGGAFVSAFESLRGSGAISEQEGSKAGASLLRATNANTPEEFYSALKDFSDTVGAARYAASTRARRGAVLPQMGQQGPTATRDNDPLGIRR